MSTPGLEQLVGERFEFTDSRELEAWLYSNGDSYPVLVRQPTDRRVAATRPLAGPPEEAA